MKFSVPNLLGSCQRLPFHVVFWRDTQETLIFTGGSHPANRLWALKGYLDYIFTSLSCLTCQKHVFFTDGSHPANRLWALNGYLELIFCVFFVRHTETCIFTAAPRKAYSFEPQAPAHQHTILAAHQHTSTPADQHTSTPARQHTSPAHQHTSTPAHKHTSTPENLQTAKLWFLHA